MGSWESWPRVIVRGLPCLWTQSKCGGVTQNSWGDLRLGLRKTFVRALLDPWVEEPRAQGWVRISCPLRDSTVEKVEQQGRWGPAWSRAKVYRWPRGNLCGETVWINRSDWNFAEGRPSISVEFRVEDEDPG